MNHSLRFAHLPAPLLLCAAALTAPLWVMSARAQEGTTTGVPAAAQNGAAQAGDTQAGDPKPVDAQADVEKTGDSKPGDAQTDHPKAVDTQSTDDTPSNAKAASTDIPLPAAKVKQPVLWTEPKAIGSLDLYAGQGGEKHAPKPPFTFVQEDKNGTNPKFDVTDADRKKWRVKLGDESRPEVVASRLLWAMGYFANDDYVLPAATVAGLKMKRGAELVKGQTVENARFARKPGGQKKIAIWEWRTNPFVGQREFNGLRVMMAVLNNWDLKDVNNAVYSDTHTGHQLFLVSDVGATFGSNGLEFSKSNAKGNVETYKGSKFITKVKADSVSFGTPSAPKAVLLASFGTSGLSYMMRKNLEWIGHDIPIQDARWMGSLLAQLSHQQLIDAFRAGNFSTAATTEYVSTLESRIRELKELSPKL